MKTSRFITRAVLAALPILLSTSAHAQMRVGDDGHANDANNRLGSGGYNQNGNLSPRGQASTNGQILHGNTTGLSYFHGYVDTFDPYDLHTSTQTGASDRLNAISGPVNYDQRLTGAPQQQYTTPFYSRERLSAPPPGSFVPNPNGVGLIAAPPVTNQPTSDTRLGIVNYQANRTALPTAGELDMPGPLDPSGNQTVLTASPLYGIKAWSPNDQNDAFFLSKFSNIKPGTANGPAQNDVANIQRMRNELMSNDQQNDNSAESGKVPTQKDLSQAQLGKTNGGLTSPALSDKPLDSSISNQSLTSNTGTNQSLQNRVGLPDMNKLPDAAKVSPQIAAMRRIAQQNKGGVTDQQAASNFNQMQLLNKQLADNAKGAKPGADKPAASGLGTLKPGADKTGTAAATPNPQTNAEKPLKPMVDSTYEQPAGQKYFVKTLADGIKSKGLADLLKRAEFEMKTGKYTAALNTYDTAQQVAPNNPFITLGRGFAELGASFYGKADADLHHSFETEPALLVGQYDLKGFLGEDRLNFIQKDLEGIFSNEKTERPAFLLAYIAHNMGDDKLALQYLDEAEKRATTKDPVLATVRENWGFPKGK